MKTIAFALTTALVCGGLASAQANSTKTSTKYYLDIDGTRP